MRTFGWLRQKRVPASATGAEVPERRCSFCKKTQRQVTNLIAGPERLYVCDGCIALLCDIVAEENHKWRKRQIKRLIRRDASELGGGMRRREIIGLLSCSLFAWAHSARAQQTHKLPRLVYLDGRTRSPVVDGLLSGLRDLGYVDGSNISLVKQEFAGPSVKEMRAAILEALPNTDILVVSGTIGGVAAKSVQSDIPMVFIAVGAPVDIGLVESLAHPGGNMTGVTFEATSETYAKRLQILKEMMPNLSRVAVMGAKDDPNFPFAMVSLKQSAPQLSVSITPIELNSADDLARIFDEMKQNQLEALIVVSGSLTYGKSKAIADLAFASRLPSCHGFKEAVAFGGLVSLGPDLVALGRQSARLADKIIKGEHPADIPVEQPAQYLMCLNLKTAKSLGLTVPPALLARADEVIE